MVKRKSHNDADTTAPLQSVAPVVKRKRRASCLGEQERKERKRAIDREAQRSLREKTKTHIAELERTIEILRDQDRNGATASLLTEIEGLRAENERLRDVIDAVRSVIGGEVFGRMAPTSSNPADPANRRQEDSAIAMPTIESAGQSSPRLRRHSTSCSQANTDTKPSVSSPSPDITPTDPHFTSNPFEFALSVSSASRTVDIDGMTVLPGLMPPPSANNGALDLGLSLGHVTSTGAQMGSLVTPDSPNPVAFAPFISEISGPDWRCPSPLVLHIDNPPLPPAVNNLQICPMWRKSNEIFSRISSCRSQAGVSSFSSNFDVDWGVEAGLLFQGIKDGWESFSNWKQSPVLQILEAMDQFLFAGNRKLTRMAACYKSFKLLKYYLNPTKEEFMKIPRFLCPSQLQASTMHPIAIDMFPWPLLRDRLVNHHHMLFSDSKLSYAYANFLHFDWPFSFEDTFYFDETLHGWYPSPLFEKYHSDVRCWTVSEAFWQGFEYLRSDIEGCEGA